MNIIKIVSSPRRYCAALIVLAAATAQAADVVDEGNFFNAATIRSASEKIQELDRLHGYRIKVETIAALPGNESEKVRQMSAGDRGKFFGHYLSARAGAEKLDLLIFASRDPKYLQVLPHKKFEAAGFTTAMRDKLSSSLIAGFHSQKYDETLTAALNQLELDLRAIHHAPLTSTRHAKDQMAFPVERGPVERMPAERQSEGSWLGPILLIAALVGGFLLIRRLISGAARPSGMGQNMAGGYGAGPGMGGGGGFMGNILGGVFGAVAGNWIYDSFFRSTAHGQEFDRSNSGGGFLGSGSDSSSDSSDYSADSYDSSGGGGDFGGDSGGGSDGGGGDGGGGDF